jgi:hypothetical protein
MKTKIYFLSILSGIALLASSCSDFLVEDNKSGKTEENYKTESGLTGLVNACYSYTRGWYGKEPGIGLSEGGTDLWLKARDNRQTGLVEYSSLQAAASSSPEAQNACLDEYWEMFYAALNACNTALYYVDKATVSDALKAQYKGEASFLRAFYYWHMVETWGPIQINKTPVLTATSEVVRNTEAEVYDFMLFILVPNLLLTLNRCRNHPIIHQTIHQKFITKYSTYVKLYLFYQKTNVLLLFNLKFLEYSLLKFISFSSSGCYFMLVY